MMHLTGALGLLLEPLSKMMMKYGSRMSSKWNGEAIPNLRCCPMHHPRPIRPLLRSEIGLCQYEDEQAGNGDS